MMNPKNDINFVRQGILTRVEPSEKVLKAISENNELDVFYLKMNPLR